MIMEIDGRCPTENDSHNAMTLSRYALQVGFHGHLQAIGEKYGSPDPHADWSKFVMARDGAADIRITRWPTLIRAWVKGEYDDDTPRMRPRKIVSKDFQFERKNAAITAWNVEADRRNAELDAEKSAT